MEFDADNLQKQIPYYLTSSDQEALIAELKAFSRGAVPEYFLNKHQDSFADVMLQGDGWRGFQFLKFETGERRFVRGVVISNSCDVDPDNMRDVPTRITFAPLVKLAAYEGMLRKAGISADQIQSKVLSIRAQRTTNMFYLPSGAALDEDYVVRFDDLYSMPSSVHASAEEREKLFTLSMTGFYLFVLKLSVHFCRLQENVIRRTTV